MTVHASQLTPWILGPSRYLIEGCGAQAICQCSGEVCRLEGDIVAAVPYRAPAASAASPAAAAVEPSAGASGATTSAPAASTQAPDDGRLRAIIDGRRAEIASCVSALPVGVQVDFAPGKPVVAGLRGPLKGTPEEQCVRAVLKDAFNVDFAAPGTVIHVVR